MAQESDDGKWQNDARGTGNVSVVGAAVILYALKVSIFKALNNSNPDVFNTCNILCASQTVGLISSAIYLRKDLTISRAKQIPRSVFLWLCVGSVLSTIVGPLFSNMGWELSSVATVSVLQKSQSVFFIIAEPILSRCKKLPSKWDAVNALLVAIGIVGTFISSEVFFGGTANISVGEMYIIIASLCFTGSLLISTRYLTDAPPGILTIFRLLVGTVSYHTIAAARGRDQYSKLWDSTLWLHMFYYGIFFVTVPQQCWLQATNTCSKPVLSTAMNLQFIIQIMFGIVVLQSFPSPQVLVGGSFILVAVISAIVKANYGETCEDKDRIEISEYRSLSENLNDGEE